jgi:hypothetical protein
MQIPAANTIDVVAQTFWIEKDYCATTLFQARFVDEGFWPTKTFLQRTLCKVIQVATANLLC